MLLDGKDNEIAKAKEILQPIAEKEFHEDPDSQEVFFLYTGEVRHGMALSSFHLSCSTVKPVVLLSIISKNILAQ